jgi:hypothetical protein
MGYNTHFEGAGRGAQLLLLFLTKLSQMDEADSHPLLKGEDSDISRTTEDGIELIRDQLAEWKIPDKRCIVKISKIYIQF